MIRLAFLPLYTEAWDSLAEVYALTKNDQRFEVEVFTINRKLTGDEDFNGQKRAHDYLQSIGVPNRMLSSQTQLREFAPDYVLINYPWQRNYEPEYRVDELVQFTRVAYVPYFLLPMVTEPWDRTDVAEHYFTQRSHQLASLIFTQDAATKEAFKLTERGGDYVHFTGSPKIDALVAKSTSEPHWPLEGNGYRILWAPHHSYAASWLNFGTFAGMREAMLDFARNNPSVQVVFRPHPFLFGTMLDRGLMTADEILAWRTSWDALPNTATDDSSNYVPQFLACDMMICDGISFLGEYPLVTGKPAVFLEREDHWKFSPLGETIAATSVRFGSFAEFEAAFHSLRENGLPDRSAEIETFLAAASPFPGQAASKIVEAIVDDYPSPLVNPASATAQTWEQGAELRRAAGVTPAQPR